MVQPLTRGQNNNLTPKLGNPMYDFRSNKYSSRGHSNCCSGCSNKRAFVRLVRSPVLSKTVATASTYVIIKCSAGRIGRDLTLSVFSAPGQFLGTFIICTMISTFFIPFPLLSSTDGIVVGIVFL